MTDPLEERLAEARRVVNADAEVLSARAVAELPENLAELIRLVHWGGFSVQEAATLMGISASKARGRHARAKQLLQQSLTPVRG